jgi:hypothetical protein
LSRCGGRLAEHHRPPQTPGKPVDPMAKAMSVKPAKLTRPAKLAKLAREDVQAILARDANGDVDGNLYG